MANEDFKNLIPKLVRVTGTFATWMEAQALGAVIVCCPPVAVSGGGSHRKDIKSSLRIWILVHVCVYRPEKLMAGVPLMFFASAFCVMGLTPGKPLLIKRGNGNSSFIVCLSSKTIPLTMDFPFQCLIQIQSPRHRNFLHLMLDTGRQFLGSVSWTTRECLRFWGGILLC